MRHSLLDGNPSAAPLHGAFRCICPPRLTEASVRLHRRTRSSRPRRVLRRLLCGGAEPDRQPHRRRRGRERSRSGAVAAFYGHKASCCPKHLPTNYMFVDGMSAFGTMLLANVLPSRIYAPHQTARTTLGPECFAPTHLIFRALHQRKRVLPRSLTARCPHSQIASAMQLASQERELL